MRNLFVFIGFFFLLYMPFSGANFRYSENECERTFSHTTTGEFSQRTDWLLSQIRTISAHRASKILAKESPETLRVLSQKLFLRSGMVKAKYNLAYALGERRIDDSEIHGILADTLLGEVNMGVVREVAHALGKINGKIDPKDSKTQWKLTKVIQSEQETKVRLQAVDALGETRSKNPAIHRILVDILLLETESHSTEPSTSSKPYIPTAHWKLTTPAYVDEGGWSVFGVLKK